jgi:hypothetical protein
LQSAIDRSGGNQSKQGEIEMAKKKKVAQHDNEIVTNGSHDGPRSAAYFDRPLRDASDLVNAVLAVCGDTISRRISASIATSVHVGVRNVIKIEEIRQKYGRDDPVSGHKLLQISS